MPMRAPHGPGPSQRALRVGELIRHALADILARGEVRDPDLERVVVSVTEVTTTPDLKHATAFVVALGSDSPRLVAALDRNKRYLRGAVAKRVNLRYAPDLHFRIDTSFEEGARIDAILRSPEVKRDLGGEGEGEEE